MPFIKAERIKSKLRLALTGVSGSGKTKGALEIAKGLGGRIAVIDTENGSAQLYSDQFNFDVMVFDAPYSPDKFTKAIREAEFEKYDVLIIDSLSHAWNGVGGVLQTVEALNGQSPNSGWRAMTPEQNKMVETILSSKLHVIVTMRCKTEYSYEKDERGKIVPVKIGLAPVQRNDLEYEFTVLLDLNHDHFASVLKNRTSLWSDHQPFLITEDAGKLLAEWLDKGVEPDKYCRRCQKNGKNVLAVPALQGKMHPNYARPTCEECYGVYVNWLAEKHPELTQQSISQSVIANNDLPA